MSSFMDPSYFEDYLFGSMLPYLGVILSILYMTIHIYMSIYIYIYIYIYILALQYTAAHLQDSPYLQTWMWIDSYEIAFTKIIVY